MYPTIEVPGRDLAQAWLAVAAACGDDDKGPKGNYRTVHLEFFEYTPNFSGGQFGADVPMNVTGVRLTATDGALLSQCWVPTTAAVSSDDFAEEPHDSVTPTFTVTAIDDDYRIRDMMKFLVKETKDDPDVDVRLSVFAKTKPAEPTLGAELDPLAFKVEIPLRETLIVDTIDGTAWINWRKVMADAAITEPTDVTIISGQMLANLSKIPKIADGYAVKVEWAGQAFGAWSVDRPVHTFSPHGILCTIRPAETKS